MKVAVIGAGYAGLAAAVELAAQGISVTVFESARQLGGRARRVDYRGMALDNGQHILLGVYRETLRLMRMTGADPAALLLRLPLQLVIPGRFRLQAAPLPAPLHLALALLTARGLTWGERLSAVRFMSAMRRRNFRLNGHGRNA
ncbi:MAG: FAD-dependent oxidoreductase, partial [Sulfuricella sp.]|nr:FAD-dependent oxidoreductase [Sulfuricella sp.]